MTVSRTARLVRANARPLDGSVAGGEELVKAIGDHPLVLLGAASHGTHEFHRLRASITRRLIESHGFNAVAVEADWPDAYRVNRFVRGGSGDHDAAEALGGFRRFPSWLWRNADVLDFAGWLRGHNENAGGPGNVAGFFGLDIYSLHKSMAEVIAYFERVDPGAARRAKVHYGCLDRFGPDPQNYGLLTAAGISESCRGEVLRELLAIRGAEARYISADGEGAADEFFHAEQNARLVKNAESYYRTMFRSDVSSRNTRDEHMMETLVALRDHLLARHGHAKIVVWAHNSHIGDARATAMGHRGEVNLGQLVRGDFPGRCKLVGFTTYTGTVTAAGGWHLPAARMQVPPGLAGSYEEAFHQAGVPRFWLDLTADNPAVEALREPRLERAIGVVYRPETERDSHYFHSCLPEQFDAVVHIDGSRAVEPMDAVESWDPRDAPDTYPTGT